MEIPAGAVLTRPTVPSTDFGTALGSKCQQKRSALPGLSTLPSFSSSAAAAESCSTPEGLFQALGASHGQGPRLGLGNQRQEETRSDSSAGFTFRAPDRLAPSGQGLTATGPARRVQPHPWPRRSGEAGGGSAGRGDERGERALGPAVAACGDPPPGPASPARPRLREKQALKRASPGPGARDRRRRAGIGAPWKVTAGRGKRDAARWVRGARAGSPRRRLGDAPASRSTQVWSRSSPADAVGSPEPRTDGRAIPASRARPGGNLRAGTGVGARWRAVVLELRASPAAAACLERRARSAAAVTVCLCQVCAAGGEGEGPRSRAGFRAGAGPELASEPRLLPVTAWMTNG